MAALRAAVVGAAELAATELLLRSVQALRNEDQLGQTVIEGKRFSPQIGDRCLCSDILVSGAFENLIETRKAAKAIMQTPPLANDIARNPSDRNDGLGPALGAN